MKRTARRLTPLVALAIASGLVGVILGGTGTGVAAHGLEEAVSIQKRAVKNGNYGLLLGDDASITERLHLSTVNGHLRFEVPRMAA